MAYLGPLDSNFTVEDWDTGQLKRSPIQVQRLADTLPPMSKSYEALQLAYDGDWDLFESLIDELSDKELNELCNH